MKLWTWQKQGFDISDRNTEVKSLENSFYPTNIANPEHFKQIYTKLYEKLGTSQFHWYFTEENEAKNEASHLEWHNQGCELWEVDVPIKDVPIKRVFKIVCSSAWKYLLKETFAPKWLQYDWHCMVNSDKDRIEKWKQCFICSWNGKSEEELWDALFLEKYVDGCTSILLRHPLNDSCIVRNPIKEGIWWEKCRYNSNPPYDCALPCNGCIDREQLKQIIGGFP